MSGKDSVIVDSLNHCMHADSVKISQLNDIIKTNTAVLDINTANNKFALDSLTNHIQICQSQIDSIYAHAEPMKHLGYYGKSIILRLQEVDLWDIYFVYFVCGIILCGIYMYVMNRSKRHELSLSNARENDDKLKIIKRIKEWINKRMYNKPKTPWQLIKKLLFIFVVFVPFLPFYYVSFISQFRDYFGPFKGNKIKRHRELYSKDGNPLLWFSTKVAFFIPLTLWIVTTVFNFFHLNFSIYHALDLPNESSAFWQIICQYLDPGNIANSQGYGGSGIALLSALLGIVCLSGFLVSAIVNVISQTRIQWQKGLINYNGVKKFKDYVVIIGINEQTASIVRRALDSDDDKYVLIQTRQDVEKVRPELESKIDDNKQDRIVYYAGDRTSYEDIEKLHLEKAIEVYILGESVENTVKKNNDDQLEKEHDAYNISCLEHISSYRKESLDEAKKKYEEAKKKLENAKIEGAKQKVLKKYKVESDKCEAKYLIVLNRPRLNVHVQFDYQSTFTAFKATHLYQKLGRDIRFIPFNIHELWAKKVLVDNLAIYPAGNKTELKVQRYNPIDTYIDKSGERIKVDDEKTVHLIIIGMNQMGTALATQAALLCHFPNFAKDKSKKTVITFIDENAIREADYYIGRYSTLFELSHYTVKEDTDNELKKRDEHNPKFNENSSGYNHLVAKIGEIDGKEIFEDCLLDVEWEFIQGNAASPRIKKHINSIVDNENKIVTIAICFNDSQQSLASAMYLPKTVYDNCNQVLVYQKSIFDVANDVARGDSDWRRYRNLFPFGMSEASYTENPFDSHLAALDYYLYEKKVEPDQVEKYFREPSFLKSVDDAWENAGIVRKTASIDSVDSIPFKLRSMGIEYCRNLDEIKEKTNAKNVLNELAETEHNRWMMQRLISGFRHLSGTEQGEIYAEVKEPTKYKRLIEEKKEIERASYYICSWKRMSKLEENEDVMASNDKSVIKLIPYLLRGQELLNVLILRSQDNRYENSQHKKALKEIFDGNFLLIEGKKEEGKKDEDEDKVFCEHAFWMADTAVSNKQWHCVTGKKVIDYEEKKELPVVNVSWHDVQDFLDILRKKSGLYFDLPSQKEWRTAADNGEQNKETWNVRTEESGEISEPVEVRIKEKSGLLHHFFGNVWEWSRSHDEQKLKKFMGGSFRFRERECQPDEDEKKDKTNHYWWHSWDADSKSDDLGFRLVWKYDRDVPTLNGNVNSSSSKESDNALSPEQNAIIEWFKKDKHELKLIKPGFFVMGADADGNQDASMKPDANEGPRHTVHISESFYICQVPVTQSLWNAVMNVKKPRLNKTENRIGDEIPQTDISWKDVCDFIETLNKEKKTILQKILPNLAEKSYEFRLPTEAEWEYAAKSAMSFFNVEEKDFINKKEGRYYSVPIEEDNDGNLLTNDNELYMRRKDVKYPLFAAKSGEKGLDPINFEGLDPTNFAWFSQPSIHEVAQKEPNALGLYDMSGNVWEWCHDYYIADMYVACKIGENKKVQNTFIKHEYQDKGYITDPIALDDSYSAHVFRGGSWRSSKWDCRCTRANYWGENYKANDLGFRLVLGRSIDDLGKAAKEKKTVNENTKTPEQS